MNDKGTGTVSVFDCDLSLALDLTRDEEGHLSVTYSGEQIHTKDYEVSLEGTADISKAVESMLTSFKVFFEEELTAMLASRLLETAETMLQRKMIGYDSADLKSMPVLVEDPIF